MHTGPEIDGFEEFSHGTYTATVSYSLCILTDDVAGAEIDNDAWAKKKKKKERVLNFVAGAD